VEEVLASTFTLKYESLDCAIERDLGLLAEADCGVALNLNVLRDEQS